MPSFAISFPSVFDRLPRVIEVGLVLLAAWLVAGWVTAAGVQQVMQKHAVPAAGSALPDVSDITSFPLFGKQAVETMPAAPPQGVPLQLNIHLLGTVVAGDRSMAVMQLAGGEQQVVFIGEDIKPGARLQEVQTDAIVVNNRGRREKVLMAKGSLGHGAAPNFSFPSGPQVMDAGHRVFTRSAIDQQMQDLPNLLTGALAIPHQTNGNPDGFLIQDIVPGSLYAQAGLKNGDVINSVNGERISTPQKGLALFQALQKAHSLDLEITRAGKVQQLHYDIR